MAAIVTLHYQLKERRRREILTSKHGAARLAN